MKLRAILAVLFIALLSLSTIVEARSYSSSSRSSSSSSRSSSSSSSSKSYSTSTPSRSTPSTPSTSSYSKSYSTSSTPRSTTTSSTSKAAPSVGYPYKQPNPAYTPPKNTATHTTTINNRTVIYSNGPGGNGSTFFDSMLWTMAGLAVYDMIIDDKGQTIKVEPYYVSGETRIPVWSGQIIPKEIPATDGWNQSDDEPFNWSVLCWVLGGWFGLVVLLSLFVKS